MAGPQQLGRLTHSGSNFAAFNSATLRSMSRVMKAVKAAGPVGKAVSLRLEVKANAVSAPLRIVGRAAGQVDAPRTATAPQPGFSATASLWLTVPR